MPSPTALIQSALGNSLDYPVLSYINSLFTSSDADPSDDPVGGFIRPLLESESTNPVEAKEIDRICLEFTRIWEKLTGAELAANANGETSGGPAKLDQALDMRRQEMKSKRGAVTQVVDIASVVSLILLAHSRAVEAEEECDTDVGESARISSQHEGTRESRS